jgi:hypothetical protein
MPTVIPIKVSSNMANKMATELINIKMVYLHHMKATSKIVYSMERELKFSQIAASTRDPTSKESRKVLALTPGQTCQHMQASGTKIRFMEKVNTNGLTEEYSGAHGLRTK